jgi:hypothetical protein
MKCLACSKELAKKDVVFTEDKHPYCSNPFTCNDLHPNSVHNIIARGAAEKMFTEEELETSIFDRLAITNEMKERIMKIASKPQSIRLSKYEIAYYLLQLQEVKELASISEAIRYCVNLAMKVEPAEGVEAPESIESSDEAVEIKKGLTGIVIPEITKSINVDWSKVEVPASVPAEEEDEF